MLDIPALLGVCQYSTTNEKQHPTAAAFTMSVAATGITLSPEDFPPMPGRSRTHERPKPFGCALKVVKQPGRLTQMTETRPPSEEASRRRWPNRRRGG